MNLQLLPTSLTFLARISKDNGQGGFGSLARSKQACITAEAAPSRNATMEGEAGLKGLLPTVGRCQYMGLCLLGLATTRLQQGIEVNYN